MIYDKNFGSYKESERQGEIDEKYKILLLNLGGTSDEVKYFLFQQYQKVKASIFIKENLEKILTSFSGKILNQK